MEQLIPIINQLQEVFSTSGSGSTVIQLPQIVVVGEQSAGKSSVLESLVGRTCLPRGKGIVTRCPIILQLHQTHDYCDDSDDEDIGVDVDEYCEFPHLPKGKRTITNFEEIVNVINKEVDKRAGTKKGIINDALIMKIFSPNVINLTVVDLPGMVKNPTGDQPHDIEQQVERLIRKYIENPNSIILAVSAATNDIATSGSLKLAKEVDPDFNRTVAVITKLDLMDNGTNATEVLTGDILNVKLGIVGVVNRSFKDIEDKKTIADSIAHEAKFLNEHYSMIAAHNGSPYLKSKLQGLLLEHIQNCLPKLQVRLSSMKIRVVDEMKKLGEDAPVNKSFFLRKIIEKFCEAFKSAITGRKFKNIERRFLTGSALLKRIFEDSLAEKLDSIDPLVDLEDEMILNTIVNSIALESGIVVPEVAFQDLVREQINLLNQPVVECATEVHEEMLHIVSMSMKSIEAEMLRFPRIKSAITGVVIDLLRERHEIAQNELSKYVSYQAKFITMKQEDFNSEIKESQENEVDESAAFGSSKLTAIKKTPGIGQKFTLSSSRSEELSSSDELNDAQLAKCQLMRTIVSKYFDIVKADVRNFWPKVIYTNMISFMEEEIHDQLIDKLYTPEKVEQLVMENIHIAERRKVVAQQFKELQKASKILAVIRDTSF